MKTHTMQTHTMQTHTNPTDLPDTVTSQLHAVPDPVHVPNHTTAPAAVDPDDYGWMMKARCRGTRPTAVFPSDGSGVDAARKVCEDCPVRVECLEYALAHRIEHGV